MNPPAQPVGGFVHRLFWCVGSLFPMVSLLSLGLLTPLIIFALGSSINEDWAIGERWTTTDGRFSAQLFVSDCGALCRTFYFVRVSDTSQAPGALVATKYRAAGREWEAVPVLGWSPTVPLLLQLAQCSAQLQHTGPWRGVRIEGACE
jgi:hypothetical protein